MSLWDKLISYITNPQNRYKAILWFLGLLLLIAVVFFGKDIQNFFKSLQSRAAGPPGTELNWENIEKDLDDSVAHTGLVEANYDGYRYLFRIGGVHKNENGEGNYISPKVERLTLNNEGAPVENQTWESHKAWEMNSGHAEFGAFQYDKYLYVVAGDIHLPAVEDPDEEVPLVFSTIERLDLDKLTDTPSGTDSYWEVIAKVSGVNFYPEVKIHNGEMHIIGGLFGLPQDTAESWGGVGTTPLIENDPRWNTTYKDLPTVGSDKLIILPHAGVGAGIEEGGEVTDEYKNKFNMGGGLVPISGSSISSGSAGNYPDYSDLSAEQQEDINNVSGLLSKKIIAGEFATTVSEHYIVDLDSMATEPINIDVSLESELGKDKGLIIESQGNDYEGNLYNTWETGRVAHIEHLRIVLDTIYNPSDYSVSLTLYPALQGRYGHEVIEQDNTLYTIGGASWTTQIQRVWLPYNSFDSSSAQIDTFWVVDDKGHPVNKLFNPSLLKPISGDDYEYEQDLDYEYEYLGNAVYKLNQGSVYTYWQGTNQESNDNPLDEDLSMPRNGRAFFGFSKYNYSSVDGEAEDHLMLGGLANNNSDNGWYDTNIGSGAEPALRISMAGETPSDPFYREPTGGTWPNNPPSNWPDHWPWPPTADGPSAGYPEQPLNDWPNDWPWPPTEDPDFDWPSQTDFEEYWGDLATQWSILDWPWPPQSTFEPPAGWPDYSDPGDLELSSWWPDTWSWPPDGSTPESGWPTNPPTEWEGDWPPSYGENDFPSGSEPDWWPSNWPWDDVVIPPAPSVDYAIGVSVTPINWVSVFKDDDSGWVIQPYLGYAAYGIHSYKIGDAVVGFGGKEVFQPSPDYPFETRHVPDYDSEEVSQTFMYKNGKVYLMGSVVEPSSEYSSIAIKTPVPDTPAGEYTYIYKAGGTLDQLESTTKMVEILGRFTTGMTGEIDISKSLIEITPLRDDYVDDVPVVRADHYDYATVTITLRDYYGNAITSAEDIPESVGVTLFTDRSIIPAIDRDVDSQIVTEHKNCGEDDNENDSNCYYDKGFEPRLDHIQMLGSAFESGDMYDTIWEEYWKDQVAKIDRGNNEDNNSATGIGQVQFRISSRKGQDSKILNALTDPILVSANLVDVNDDNNIWERGSIGQGAEMIFTRHGYPNPEKSKIYSDNAELDSENNYNADIYLEAIDYWSDPVTDIRVKLESARNIGAEPGDEPDAIDPEVLIYVDDITGEAVFNVESGAHGIMQLMASYEADIPGHTDIYGQPTVPPVRGYITLMLDTKGKILYITPDYGYQGENIVGGVTAYGELTTWRDDLTYEKGVNENTRISALPPQDMEFYYYDNSNPKPQPAENLFMAADGTTNYALGVSANPGDEVELTILDGDSPMADDGTFLPCNYGECPIKTITVTGDYDYFADFNFRPGLEAGILKISAHNKTTDVTGELWVPIAEFSNNLSFGLETDPDPASVETGEGVNITVTPLINGHTMGNPGEKMSNYVAQMADDKSELSDGSVVDGVFNVDFIRTPNSEPGFSRVFVTALYDNEHVMVGVQKITKPLEDESSQGITYQNITVGSETELTAENVSIGESAHLGLWNINLITIIDGEVYEESTLFRVVDSTYSPDGKYIKTVEPNIVTRGKTHTIDIEAINTTFVVDEGDNQSQVTFTLYEDPDSSFSKSKTLTAEIISGDLDSLTVELEVDHNTPLGFYDIQVSTPVSGAPPELVEKIGHRDLWITTEANGYFVDMEANPKSVLRDAKTTSEVTAVVGHADYGSGDIEYYDNQEVNFDWHETIDDGWFFPHHDSTSSEEGAITVYHSDFSLEDGEVGISGKTIIDEYGGEVSNYVIIQKLGYEDNDPNADVSQTTISAVPKYVRANGNDYSLVTVTVRNAYFVPLEGYEVILSTDRGDNDIIELENGSPGNSTDTNEDGQTIFLVSSATQGISEVTAEVSDFEVSTEIYFEDPTSLIPRVLDVTVPFQSRDYDNLVWVYVTEEQTSGDPLEFINEVYTKTASPDDKLEILSNITMYFHPDETYNIWVKGRYHLGRTETFYPGSDTGLDVIEIDMTRSGLGLLIGDLMPDVDGDGNTTAFHDNYVNTVDFQPLFNSIFDDVGDAAENIDWPINDIINTLDLGLLFTNYGGGEAGGPPPHYDD